MHIISAADRTMNTTTESMQVGSVTRQYEVIKPQATLSDVGADHRRAGRGRSSNQRSRSPGTSSPPTRPPTRPSWSTRWPIEESWNAIGCCDGAAKANVNDVGFIEALVAKIDPGNTRPIYVIGYSNGGRLAYRMACTDPMLFDGMAAVKADPMPGCDISVPQKILQVASTDDTDTPYTPGKRATSGNRRPPWSRTTSCAMRTSARPSQPARSRGT